MSLKELSVASLIRGCEVRGIQLAVDHEHARLKITGGELGRQGPFVEELRLREREILGELGFTLPPDALVVQSVQGVEEESVQWLWPERIAIGKLTLITGDVGVGKSYLAADLAGRVSSGKAWPLGTREGTGDREQGIGGKDEGQQRSGWDRGGTVFMIGGEDRVADTLRPRLRVAGADLKRVFVVNAIKHRDWDGEVVRGVDLARDLETIERTIVAAGGCRLLIIDPMGLVCGGGRGMRGGERLDHVEEVLRRLLELATKHRFAVVAFGGKERTKVNKAVAAAARGVYSLVEFMGDKTGRFLVPMKNDLSENRDVLAFCFGRPGEKMPPLLWLDSPDGRSSEEVVAEARYRRRFAALRFEVEAFLKGELQRGARGSKEIMDLAREIGYAEKTVRYVYRMAGGWPKKMGMKGGWVWSWPCRWGGREGIEDREQGIVGREEESRWQGGWDAGGGSGSREALEGEASNGTRVGEWDSLSDEELLRVSPEEYAKRAMGYVEPGEDEEYRRPPKIWEVPVELMPGGSGRKEKGFESQSDLAPEGKENSAKLAGFSEDGSRDGAEGEGARRGGVVEEENTRE